MDIIQISPYEKVVGFVKGDTTIELTFAIKNFKYNKQNINVLDTFVLNRLPKRYLSEHHGILFIFYKYERGKIDENFRHYDEPKQSNLFMEAGAESLIEYEWLHGKFMSVSIFKRGMYYKSEKRNW